MYPIPRSRQITVQCTLNTGKGARLQFPIEQFLQGKKIVGLETVSSTELTNAQNGLPVADPADLAKAVVTLVDTASNKVHKGVPLVLLDPGTNFGVYRSFTPVVLDWQKCEVQLTDTPAFPAGVTFYYVFLVHYMD